MELFRHKRVVYCQKNLDQGKDSINTQLYIKSTLKGTHVSQKLGNCVEIKITCSLKIIKTKKVRQCDVDEERDDRKIHSRLRTVMIYWQHKVS